MNQEEREDDPKELALEVLSLLRAAEGDVLELLHNLDGDARRGEGGGKIIEFPRMPRNPILSGGGKERKKWPLK